MPVVFREDGFRFHFYSDEGNPREPVHIHVAKPGVDVKFWLYPDVEVAYNHGCNSVTVNRLSRIAKRRRDEIREFWDDYFS
jgi:Domain of unknown function (DUF4160)